MPARLPSRRRQKHFLTDAIGTRIDHKSMSGCAFAWPSSSFNAAEEHRRTAFLNIRSLRKHTREQIGYPGRYGAVTWYQLLACTGPAERYRACAPAHACLHHRIKQGCSRAC